MNIKYHAQWAVTITACLSLAVPFAQGKTIYVDDSAIGANNGNSWINAYVSLQDALVEAGEVKGPMEIHVAQGVYRPDQGVNQVPGDVEATFLLLNGITVKGGFAGLGLTDPNVRDIRNFATVLHGDLNGDDDPEFADYANNSQTIVTSVHNENTAVLDGFTITGGLGWSGPGISCYDSNALFMNCEVSKNKSIGREGGYGGGMFISGGSPTLINCLFHTNWALAEGGGLWCQGWSKPTLLGCQFRGNFAATGGGMSVAESFPVITNCLFENNEALYGAGLGIHYMGHPLVNHCTFYGNRGQNGGVLYIGYKSLVTVNNCILWNDGPEIINGEDSSIAITFSDINGYWPGQGNLNIDPLFAAPGHWVHMTDPNTSVEPNDPNAVWLDGDYHLKSQAGRWTSTGPVDTDPDNKHWVFDDVTSPCIDAGDPNDPVALEPHANGGIINMGAYGGTVQASMSTDVNCVIRYQSDFNHDEDGWSGGFADYPVSVLPQDWRMEFDYGRLPVSLDLGDANGLMLQGSNHSDDLFMYAKRLFGGLCPNSTYEVLFQVTLASNAPTGSGGVGGSPGDSVYVKVGVSSIEPNAILAEDDYWRMNIDKANQSQSGENAVTVGTVGVDLAGPGLGLEYKLKTLSNATSPLHVDANDQGDVWLLVGTDSGFESLTRIYLTDIEAEFVRIQQ